MTDLARFEYAILQGLEERFRLQSIAIANIGCGYCDECEVLLSLFPDATLTAVDLDHHCIDSVHSRLAGSEGRGRFITGNAAQLAKIARGPYDFAVIRHPDISKHRLLWAEVFDSLVGQMRIDGFVMALTYTTAEAEFVRSTMKSLPVQELALDLANSPPVALAGNDRHIMLYHKC